MSDGHGFAGLFPRPVLLIFAPGWSGALQQMVQHFLETNAPGVSRLEVLEGPTGRRRWSVEAKAAIVAESFLPGVRVADVARRHGLTPQQLTGWRRLAREGKLVLPADETAMTFAPVVVEGEAPGTAETPVPDADRGIIEVETSGMVLRVPTNTPPGRLAELVSALRDLA